MEDGNKNTDSAKESHSIDLDLVKQETVEEGCKNEEYSQCPMFENVFIKEEISEQNTPSKRNETCSDQDMLEVYNLYKNIEFTEEEDLVDIKFELSVVEPNKYHCKLVKDGFILHEDGMNAGINEPPHFEVKTPARTYRRANKRSTPSNTQEKELNVQKVEDIVQKCLTTEKALLTPTNSKPNLENEEDLAKKYLTTEKVENPTKGCSRKKKKYLSDCNTKLSQCVFCNLRYSNMNSHLLKEHSGEIEISCIKDHSPKSPARIKQLIRLRRIGNFKHNILVLQYNVGELIVLKSSEKYVGQCSQREFLPCPDCAGFVHKSKLRFHHQKCVVKHKDALKISKRHLTTESLTMINYTFTKKLDQDWLFSAQVLDKMTSNFGVVAKTDPLILLLAKHIAITTGSRDVYAAVKNSMKKMGCLLISCRTIIENPKIFLPQLLIPENINVIMASVKNLLSSNKDLETFELCSSLYPLIVASVFLWRGKCLLENGLTNAEKTLRFYYEFVNVWETEISGLTVGTNCIKVKTLKNSLPLTGLVMSLKVSLTSRLIKFIDDLKSSTSDVGNVWFNLAETTICLLCMFNSVDFEAVEALKITEYAVRPDWSVDNVEDYHDKTTPITCYLAAKRLVVCTEYFGEKIVILFTKEIKKAIDILIMKRKDALVSPENPYVFSKQGFNEKSTFKAASCFFNLCIKKGGLDISVMKTLKDRQYIAYVTQISDMSPSEILWVREYLSPNGYSKKLLKDPFAQALHVYDMHVVNDYSDSKTSNQSIDFCEQVQKENGELQDNKEKSTIQKLTPAEIEDAFHIEEEVFSEENTSALTFWMSETEEAKNDISLKEGKRPINKYWSTEEKQYVIVYFENEITNEEIPSKAKCQRCLSVGQLVIKGRSLNSIRGCVAAEIERRKKVQEEDNPLFCDI